MKKSPDVTFFILEFGAASHLPIMNGNMIIVGNLDSRVGKLLTMAYLRVTQCASEIEISYTGNYLANRITGFPPPMMAIFIE